MKFLANLLVGCLISVIVGGGVGLAFQDHAADQAAAAAQCAEAFIRPQP